jgi:hypothetical protein
VEAAHADILCIQEEKNGTIPQRVIVSALRSCLSGFLELSVAGASGGVMFRPLVIAGWTTNFFTFIIAIVN